MKIAIPEYTGNVSNVFDFARRGLLVDIENGREVNRAEVLLSPNSLPQTASRLQTLGVNVLICGAISRPAMYMLVASGIQVLPYVTGHIDDVLQAYLAGRLVQPQFTMPGCWPGARKGFGRWRRGCQWRARPR
jgi:predicted Fe-Mo cluster-binding NifX family protein